MVISLVNFIKLLDHFFDQLQVKFVKEFLQNCCFLLIVSLLFLLFLLVLFLFILNSFLRVGKLLIVAAIVLDRYIEWICSLTNYFESLIVNLIEGIINHIKVTKFFCLILLWDGVVEHLPTTTINIAWFWLCICKILVNLWFLELLFTRPCR